MRLPLLRNESFAVTFIMLIGILIIFMSSLHAAEKKVDGRNATVVNWGADPNNILFTFTKLANGTWSQVQVNSGKIVDTLKELNRDQWTIYLSSIPNGTKVGLNLWRKEFTSNGKANKGGKIVSSAASAPPLISSKQVAEKKVDGRNATVVNWGSDPNNILFAFTKLTDGTWTQVQVSSGKTIDTLKEVNRDQWTIYLSSIVSRKKVGLNLWKKEFTSNGIATPGGKIVSSAASVPLLKATATRSATLSVTLPQKPKTPTPPKDESANSGTDVVATGTGLAKIGVAVGKGIALGAATVTQGPLFEGQSPADLGNIKKSPNSTLKNLCTVLSFASSGAKAQVNKAKKKKMQEKVIGQWADILFDAQTQSGISIAAVDGQSLINAMAQEQNKINNGKAESATPVDTETLMTGYRINDPGKKLKKGATEIPVIGPAKFMIVNKDISFKGVSGAHKLTRSYDGKSGKLFIKPGLSKVPAHNTLVQTKLEYTSFDIARQALEIAGIADPTGTVAVAAAYVHPVCGSEDANRSKGDYCYRHSDTRGVGTIPIACNPSLPDHQAGLCYKTCTDSYNGVGPVCWTTQKVSIPRGVGVIPSGCPASHQSLEGGLCYKKCAAGWSAKGTICYQDCPASGYRDDGLYCGKKTYSRGGGYPLWDKGKCHKANSRVGGCEKKGLIWYPKCEAGTSMTTVNFCATKGCPSGFSDIGVSCKKPSRGRGVGVPRNVCAANVPDLDAGLCYKKCEPGYKGVGPVCWTQKPVSQGRGVGLVPDQCTPSHPNFDAGLCYKNCPNQAYKGVGPVCWGGCDGRYKEPCGVGCATTKLACGLVTTEMVIAPLEAVASILSLGGYSLVDKAKDAAKKGLKEAVDAADGPAAKAFGRTIGQKAAKAAKKSLNKLDNLSKGLAKRKNAIVKAIKDNTLEPVKDTFSKVWAKGAKKRLNIKASILAKRYKKELLASGTSVADFDKVWNKKVAKLVVAQEAAEKAAKKAAKKASKANSAKMLKRIEIKDKILRKLSQSWNNTDKAWTNVARKCTALGLNVANDWKDAQH